MYEIKKDVRTLPDGKEITTYSREIIDANLFEVEAGTTGYMGGDSGHGGRTYFRISDLGGTDIKVRPIDSYKGAGTGGFEVFLGGDRELVTIMDALKFILKVLDEESRGVQD